jgi:hypothetical protein
MNPEHDPAPPPQRWPAHRWWGFVAVILTLQIALIYWLGDEGPVLKQPPRGGVRLQLAGSSTNELLSLMDPTLLALPHRESFGGQAWLTIPSLEAPPFVWSEPSRWLELPVAQLGGAFRAFLETNPLAPPTEFARHEPEFATSDAFYPQSDAQTSGFRIVGELAGRRLLTPFSLESWTNADLLTNTIVQVVADARGRPVYVTLLAPSGSREADTFALKAADTARFDPLPAAASDASNPMARLSWGQIIFDWHTEPVPPTNGLTKP